MCGSRQSRGHHGSVGLLTCNVQMRRSLTSQLYCRNEVTRGPEALRTVSVQHGGRGGGLCVPAGSSPGTLFPTPAGPRPPLHLAPAPVRGAPAVTSSLLAARETHSRGHTFPLAVLFIHLPPQSVSVLFILCICLFTMNKSLLKAPVYISENEVIHSPAATMQLPKSGH